MEEKEHQKPYPHLNRKTTDLVGEKWKEIKGYDGRYMISNLGRVKSFYYETVGRRRLGGERVLRERILAIQIHREYNSVLGDYREYLVINLRANRKNHTNNVSRLVCAHFLKELNSNECVLHTNGDSFDNRPENLEIRDRKYVARAAYEKGRLPFVHGLSNLHTTESRLKQSEMEVYRCPVTQYDLRGHRTGIFSTMIEAAEKNGTSPNRIRLVCDGRALSLKDYIWRYGKGAKCIDVYEITERRKKGQSGRRSVTQFDLSGNVVATFKSLKEAAESLKTSPKNVRSAATGKTISAAGFLWRYGEHVQALDITEVTARTLSNNKRKGSSRHKKVSQYGLDGRKVAQFDTIADAGRAYKRDGIKTALKSNRHTAYGFIWIAGEGPDRLPRKQLKQILESN